MPDEIIGLLLEAGTTGILALVILYFVRTFKGSQVSWEAQQQRHDDQTVKFTNAIIDMNSTMVRAEQHSSDVHERSIKTLEALEDRHATQVNDLWAAIKTQNQHIKDMVAVMREHNSQAERLGDEISTRLGGLEQQQEGLQPLMDELKKLLQELIQRLHTFDDRPTSSEVLNELRQIREKLDMLVEQSVDDGDEERPDA